MNSLGQRTCTQHTGTAFGTPSCRHRFLSNGWNVQPEYNLANGAPSLTAENTWGLDQSNSDQGTGGIGGLLTRTSGGATHSYTYDGNGNVSELVTSTGSVAGHYEYGPFGQTTFQTIGSSVASANPYRFSTKPLNEVGGLFYYGYRFYDSETGRGLNRDSIGEKK